MRKALNNTTIGVNDSYSRSSPLNKNYYKDYEYSYEKSPMNKSLKKFQNRDKMIALERRQKLESIRNKNKPSPKPNSKSSTGIKKQKPRSSSSYLVKSKQTTRSS